MEAEVYINGWWFIVRLCPHVSCIEENSAVVSSIATSVFFFFLKLWYRGLHGSPKPEGPDSPTARGPGFGPIIMSLCRTRAGLGLVFFNLTSDIYAFVCLTNLNGNTESLSLHPHSLCHVRHESATRVKKYKWKSRPTPSGLQAWLIV